MTSISTLGYALQSSSKFCLPWELSRYETKWTKMSCFNWHWQNTSRPYQRNETCGLWYDESIVPQAREHVGPKVKDR